MATAAQVFRGDAHRAKIVELRLAGHTLEKIAETVGLAGASSARYHLDAWLAEQKPSGEQTEELRHLQLAQVDAITAKLWPHLEDDEGRPRVEVVDRLAKLMDRKARLMGLDLTTSSVTINVTAEGLAAALGFDDSVIDVEADAVEEITDGT